MVVVQDDLIVYVGTEDDAPTFHGADLIDARGGTILPGIINAHVHEVLDPRVRAQMLAGGVTSIGLTAAPWSDIRVIESETGAASPRVFWCGPMLAAPGGFPGVGLGLNLIREIAGEPEARSTVLELATEGASFIKIALELGSADRQLAGRPLPVLSEELVRTIVDTAHANGLPVRAHVTDDTMARMAISCDVDSIEHVPRPLVSHSDLQAILTVHDPVSFLFDESFPEYGALLVDMAHATALVPTLTSAGQMLDGPDATREEQVMLAVLLEAVRRFHLAGGLVGLGNDYPEPGAEVGMPIYEMLLLQRAGLSPLEVITAATRNAALVCGRLDEVGTLEAGKLADILIISGDPARDIEDLLNVVLVMQGGVVVHGLYADNGN